MLCADEQARAAVSKFQKWYEQNVDEMDTGPYQCTLENSPLSVARRCAPHGMLYFLLVVLQRMVHKFCGTATFKSYVQSCVAANVRCPAAIIGLLFYLKCPDLSPDMNVAMPDTKKARIHGSDVALVPAQAAASAASPDGTAGADSAEPGVWTPSSDVDTSPAAPSQSRVEQLRLQDDVARRFAYSQLEQHARRTIASADWSWLPSPSGCVNILEAFATYQGSNVLTRQLLNVKAVVAEIRLTVQFFSQSRLWPVWVLQPNVRFLRRLPQDETAYEDFGNENFEVLVNVMNLSSVIESVFIQEVFNAPANAAYGDRGNKSSVGSYNFRANVVEHLLTFLLQQRQQESREVCSMAS